MEALKNTTPIRYTLRSDNSQEAIMPFRTYRFAVELMGRLEKNGEYDWSKIDVSDQSPLTQVAERYLQASTEEERKMAYDSLFLRLCVYEIHKNTPLRDMSFTKPVTMTAKVVSLEQRLEALSSDSQSA